MLYVSTRNQSDVCTANRVMLEHRDKDGGFYIPFKHPKFSGEEIATLKEKSFNQCVADILNLLFNTSLTSWDVDFSVGRYPVRLKRIGHRTDIAELWHNPDWDFQRMKNNLSVLLSKDDPVATDWIKIAVRIAVFFGIYGEMQNAGIDTMDVSVVSGDFSVPISAWYARKWGLPIGNIICCCNENNGLWDLICHGHLRTDGVSVPTLVPEADVTVPTYLEHLVYEAGGADEVEKYLQCCRSGGSYHPDAQVFQHLRDGIFVSVVSSKRIQQIIPSVFRTHSYIMDPSTALAYTGMQDYRSKASVARHTLVVSEKSPACNTEIISRLLGITDKEIKEIL